VDKVAAALLAFLTVLADKILAVLAGMKMQQAKDTKDELERVEEAMRAAAINSTRSVDERLRDAKQRGLYRVRGEKADN
jgi:cytochrome oxidase assembly protein ShyY1